jgi:DNA end-binding protein Ku
MAPRSTWKGFLKLSLVSIPVKAFTASASGGDIHLNQLHRDCNNRINYKKTCPVHGEVTQDQIVSGYEYSKGQYVVIDPDELDKLRSEDDKAVKIDQFIPAGGLDPVYYTGKTYYLVPDGPVAQKAYSVLHQGMLAQQRHAVAQVVFHGREQIVLLRPMDGLLGMSTLVYEPQVIKPGAFEEEAPKATAEPEEMKLIKALIDAASAKTADLSRYKDLYTERLTQLIEAKVAGKEIVAVPAQEQAQVINLMDALRQSVEQAKKTTAAERPPKKMAASTKGREAAASKKRKSS